MNDIRYIINLRTTDYIRVRILVERPRTVVTFTLQYEAIIDGEVFPVVRYDRAHGYPHRDTLDDQGRVVDKFWLSGWANQEALDYAIADLKANYSAYRIEFTERMRGQ